MDTRVAEKILTELVETVSSDPLLVKGDRCAACHVLFALGREMDINEVDASALLSEVLLKNDELDIKFIDMVEKVHMKQRMAGVTFSIKTREAKNRYLDSQLKNSLEELLSDASSFGIEAVMRKMVLAYAALQIAQNIGIDYHAASEELYHLLRRYGESDSHIENLILSLSGRVRK